MNLLERNASVHYNDCLLYTSGVGASVVNALSEWLTVQVHKNGKIYEMKFSRGKITQEMTIIGSTDHTGTTVTFKPCLLYTSRCV